MCFPKLQYCLVFYDCLLPHTDTIGLEGNKLHIMLGACSTNLTFTWPSSQCASTQPAQPLLKEPGIVPQVAVEKSKGSLSSAIELLRKYVDTYMLDRAAWEELGELYLQVWDEALIQSVLRLIALQSLSV